MSQLYLWILVILMGIGKNAISQSPQYLDDAKEYFNKSFTAASQRDTGSALLYADSMRMVYAAADDSYGEIKYLFSLGVIERSKGNTQQFYDYISRFIEGATQEKDTSMLAAAFYQLAIATGSLGKLDESIKNHYESMRYYELSGDSTSRRHSLNMIGSTYRKLKQYDEAEKHFLEALEINKKGEFLSGQADNLVNLGNLYGELEDYDKAIEAYRQATFIDSLTNFSWGLAYDYENLGNLYSKQKKFSEALVLQNKALTIREQLGGKFELAQSNLKIGEIYQATERSNQALGYLNTALDYAIQASVAESQRDIYKALYRTQKKLGNYKKAIEYQDAYVSLNDSLLNQSTTEKITTLSVQYETEKKEQEITLLNTENELAQSRLNLVRRQVVGLLVGLLLFAAFLFVVIRLYRKTQYQNKLISKALSEKEILLKEIHHRVKNNLQFISSLLALQTEHVEDDAALGALQEGQDRVHSMALIHQNLYQEENLTGVDMKTYFTKLIRGLFESYNIRKDQVLLELDIADVNLDVDTVIPIGLIVNELVSNSLKYAFPGNQKGMIKVGLQEVRDILNVSVSDNGIGMKDEQINQLGNSFGFRLVHVFRDQLKADLNIDGSNGTNVTILIRKYEKV